MVKINVASVTILDLSLAKNAVDLDGFKNLILSSGKGGIKMKCLCGGLVKIKLFPHTFTVDGVIHTIPSIEHAVCIKCGEEYVTKKGSKDINQAIEDFIEKKGSD